MDMPTILKLAENMLKQYGLNSWSVFQDRSKTAYGRCHFYVRQLSFSKELVNHSDEDILETIKHEVAHARAYVTHLDDGHGKAWRDTYISMGGSGKQYADKELTTNYLWHGSCNCGKIFKRHRRVKNAYCPMCRVAVVWTNQTTGESGTFSSVPDGVEYRGGTFYAPKGLVWSATSAPWLDESSYENRNELFADMSYGFEKDPLLKGNP